MTRLVIDPQLPSTQAGFCRGHSITDQVTLLSNNIEAALECNQNIRVIFFELTAAYDTVWLCVLHLKLLQMITDGYMVPFPMELLSNRSFQLRTSDGQVSRLRRIRNGVPQGSILTPILFNIYISDIMQTTSTQYGYADDLALLSAHKTWKAMDLTLNYDMHSFSNYLVCLQFTSGDTMSPPSVGYSANATLKYLYIFFIQSRNSPNLEIVLHIL